MNASSQPKSQIIDSNLYKALIKENQVLRDRLINVSSVGISAMFHTHRSDAERFDRTVLKGVTSLMQHLEVKDLQNIYEQGYKLASAPSVIEQLKYPHLKS